MVPKLFVYVARNPYMSCSRIARYYKMSKLSAHTSIRKANKSKYAKKAGDQIISGGHGYVLLSKATVIDLAEAYLLRMSTSLKTICNTRGIAYNFKIDAEEKYKEITSDIVPKIASAVRDITRPLSTEEQVEIYKNKIKQLEQVKNG